MSLQKEVNLSKNASRRSIIHLRNTVEIPSGPIPVEDVNLLAAARMDFWLTEMFDFIDRLDSGRLLAATVTCAGDIVQWKRHQ